MNTWEALLSLTPDAPNWRPDWDACEATGLAPLFREMAETPQNPEWHGEGDVWTHTKLVCEALTALDGFRRLPVRQRQEIFLAALLHDIGKPPVTRMEDGVWVSPNHAATGAKRAREILWRDFGMSGTARAQQFRECVCTLIRYHARPLYLSEYPHPERVVRKSAAQGELIPDFTLDLLALLGEADLRGRIYRDTDKSLENLQYFRQTAEAAGCLYGPGHFASDVTKRAYFAGQDVQPELPLCDDTWGEIILMCGLPGTGKDTWIARNCPELPMVSLDEIRKEQNLPHTGPQNVVGDIAEEQARAYLRQKQPFVWNATNLTLSLRERMTGMFEQSHAAVRIVWLETDWETNLRQNRDREDVVPVDVIEQMLSRFEPPERFEARRVEWLLPRETPSDSPEET